LERTVDVPFLTAAAVLRRRSEPAVLDEALDEASDEASDEDGDIGLDVGSDADWDAGSDAVWDADEEAGVDVDVEVLVASPDVSGLGFSSVTGSPPRNFLAR
jgi:hypothetical protein